MSLDITSTIHTLSDDTGVQRSTLKSQVAEKLAYMIATRLIAPGDRLPSERELSATYDVSRETIRGALRILVTQGYIEVSHGARARVLTPPVPQSGDLFPTIGELQNYDVVTVADARKVVEASILRAAAIHISDESLSKLEVLMDTQAQVLDDPVAFQISDREFHNVIYTSGENDLLAKVALDIYSYALDFRNMALQNERATERSLREHKAIFRALSSHDPDAAERAITQHVDSIFKSSVMMSNALGTRT